MVTDCDLCLLTVTDGELRLLTVTVSNWQSLTVTDMDKLDLWWLKVIDSD